MNTDYVIQIKTKRGQTWERRQRKQLLAQTAPTGRIRQQWRSIIVASVAATRERSANPQRQGRPEARYQEENAELPTSNLERIGSESFAPPEEECCPFEPCTLPLVSLLTADLSSLVIEQPFLAPKPPP